VRSGKPRKRRAKITGGANATTATTPAITPRRHRFGGRIESHRWPERRWLTDDNEPDLMSRRIAVVVKVQVIRGKRNRVPITFQNVLVSMRGRPHIGTVSWVRTLIQAIAAVITTLKAAATSSAR